MLVTNEISRLISELGLETSPRFDEPMAFHTTFRVGGPADIYFRPEGKSALADICAVFKIVRSRGIPLFILGGGANIVVSDEGIRGLVLDMGGWSGCDFHQVGPYDPDSPPSVYVKAGTDVDVWVDACAERKLGGPEFLAGMPGSVGGAIWMNARCYGSSVSDLLQETEILDGDANQVKVPFDPADFGYKTSPFQKDGILILGASFRLQDAEETTLREEGMRLRADREAKGHYRYPSAGSVFKNDHAFGKPSGKIIDELGLRGSSIGGASIAPWHGNIIINSGGAKAADIRALVEFVAERVHKELGLSLEPEILFVGDW